MTCPFICPSSLSSRFFAQVGQPQVATPRVGLIYSFRGKFFWLILVRAGALLLFRRPVGFALISLDTTFSVAHVSMLRFQAVSLFMFSRSLVACFGVIASGASSAYGTAASYLKAHRDPASSRKDVAGISSSLPKVSVLPCASAHAGLDTRSPTPSGRAR